MKAVITNIIFKKEVDTKYGKRYSFEAHYNDKKGSFLSNTKEQTTFKIGEENEFTETPREYNGTTFYNLKAISQGGGSNFNRQLKREQSKYSGFAMSYAKDLVVAGKIEEKQMFATAKIMMDWMVEQDKNLGNG